MPRWTFVTIEERFWSKVEFTDLCWLWTASTTTMGYGQFKMNGRGAPAHRWAYEYLLDARVPAGLELDHLCRNRRCVRPDHLEAVTHQVNILRADFPTSHRTHCPQGHPYSGENLIVRALGRRGCRECRNSSKRRNRALRKTELRFSGGQVKSGEALNAIGRALEATLVERVLKEAGR